MVQKSKKSKNSKMPYIIGLVAVLVIAGGIYTYHLANKTNPIPTVDQYTKGQAGQPGTPNNTASSSTGSSTSNSEGSKTPGTSSTISAPTGNFVSDHHPNLSGSPAPNSMTSVCNTTPGAKCQISFSSGGTTKSLPAQTTDAGGATYWYWKLQDIGLTAGNWTITATSSLGSNSQSATDPMTLVVAQ